MDDTQHQSARGTIVRGRRHRLRLVAVVATAGVVLAGCGGDDTEVPEATAGQVTTIDSAQGSALIEEGGVLVIDVRTVDEYRGGHLVGAQSIPVEDEALWAERTEPLDRDQPTIVYCRSGRRSAVAAQKLVDMGFTQVYDLGGVEDWASEDLQVESP